MAERAVRTDLAATGPSDGTWNRVLRNPAQETSKGTRAMSTATLSSQSTGFSSTPQESVGQSIRRYSSMAATIALVLAVAVGGWLAMSQMTPGSDGRFAAIQATPEVAQAQTCDIEPLTVDEVMEIVRNPYRYLSNRADSDFTASADLDLATEPALMEGLLFPDHSEFDSANRSRPNEVQFDGARHVIDRYIACLPSATYGHLWAMVDPVWVQQHVLGSFPVFADEDAVRTFVEQKINQRLGSSYNVTFAPFYEAYDSPSIVANPNLEMADLVSTSTWAHKPLVATGVLVIDEDGQAIMETDSSGFPHQIRDGAVPQRPVVVVGQSTITGQWYVLPWLGN
jgi:hypothetical protein